MGIVASISSHVLYFIEKISLCCIAVMLVSCTIITITFTLAFGMGLGYNYCIVDQKTRYKHVPAHYRYRGSPFWHGNRYARVGDESGFEEDDLRSPQIDTDLDENNPLNVAPSTPDRYQPNAESNESGESSDDNKITDNTTETPVYNATEEYSTDPANVTEVTRTSQPNNSTEGLKTTKMVIPLSGLDLIGLLTRLRAENKNYTLQIVTD